MGLVVFVDSQAPASVRGHRVVRVVFAVGLQAAAGPRVSLAHSSSPFSQSAQSTESWKTAQTATLPHQSQAVPLMVWWSLT